MASKIEEQEKQKERAPDPVEARKPHHGLHKPYFNLDLAFQYYAIMRFIGYTFEGTYSQIVRKISSKNSDDSPAPNNSREPKQHHEPNHKVNTSSTSRGWETKTDKAARAAEAAEKLKTEKLKTSTDKTGWIKSTKAVDALEAVTFLAWSAFTFHRDRKQMIERMGEAVAAERGINPDTIGIMKLEKTDNPLLASMMDKFNWQTVTRFGTDSLFLVGLKTGIMGKAASITLERSVFMNKIAFEKLFDLIEETKWNNLGGKDKPQIVLNLATLVQQCCREMHIPAATKEQVDAQMPVLERLADNIINKKFGINEAAYVLGDVVLRPHDPMHTMNEMQKVETRGLKAMAFEKMREKGLHVPPANQNQILQESPETRLSNILARGAKSPLSHAVAGSSVGKGI